MFTAKIIKIQFFRKIDWDTLKLCFIPIKNYSFKSCVFTNPCIFIFYKAHGRNHDVEKKKKTIAKNTLSQIFR